MISTNQKEFFERLKENPNTIYERLIRNGNERPDEDAEIIQQDINTSSDYKTALYSSNRAMKRLITNLLEHLYYIENKISELELENYKGIAEKIISSMYLNKEKMQEYLQLIEKITEYITDNAETLPGAIIREYYRISKYFEDVTSSEIVRNHITIVKMAQNKGIACEMCRMGLDEKFVVFHNPRKLYINNGTEFISVNSIYTSPEKQEDITIKIYARIKKDKIAEVMSDIMVLADVNKIPIYYKTRSYETNDMLTIRLESSEHLDTIVNFLKSNPDIITTNHPFMPMFDGIGITFDQGNSYNGFITEQIKMFIKENKEGDYKEFVDYLNSKKEQMSCEKLLFIKNLLLSSYSGLTIEDFKREYQKALKEVEYAKDINRIQKALHIRGLYYPTPQELIEKIEEILQEILTKYNIAKTKEELLFELTEETSVEEYIKNSYRRILEERKNGSIPGGYIESCHYFTKSLAEKWVNETGAKYAESGVRAFKLLYEDNKESNRYKNAKLKYGKDFEEFMTETFGEIEYDFFKTLAKMHIERLKAHQNLGEITSKSKH